MVWDLDPEWVSFTDGGGLRWYALAMIVGWGIAALAAHHLAHRIGIAPKNVTGLLMCAFAGALVGGHLGHLALYEPESLSDPVRLAALGSGQASHGALLGGVLAIWAYARARGESLGLGLDACYSGAVVAIPFQRLGNLANSELVGAPWDGAWAVSFPRYDCRSYLGTSTLDVECVAPPRHPWPIYAALAGVALIGLAVYLHARWAPRLRPGVVFLVLVSVDYGARFLLGFVHEEQALRDLDAVLTVEQWASLPIVLASALVLVARRASLLRDPDPA